MVVIWTKATTWLCLWAIFAQPFLLGETNQASRGGAAASQPRRPKDGFADYTLKRINPNDTNYGQCIDDGRRLLLAETIENGYFWSNLVTLALLALFFSVMVFQWRASRRRALISAEALCQYQSALARAEAHASDATRRNHDLMAALRLATDPATRRQYQEPAAGTEVMTSSVQPPTGVREKKASGKPAPSSASAQSASAMRDQTGASTAAQDRQRNTEVPSEAVAAPPGLDLVAQNNALQQQLLLTQDQVKQMRRQLNESERQLQAEKQKNRSLKGE